MVLLMKICKIQPSDYLFLVVFISINIIGIICKFVELHSTTTDQNIFVTNFPFLTDSLNPPHPTPLTAKNPLAKHAKSCFFYAPLG